MMESIWTFCRACGKRMEGKQYECDECSSQEVRQQDIAWLTGIRPSETPSEDPRGIDAA